MKSILIIVPFDNIYPPMNGGMQRCFHIMHQLSKHFKLTAIIHQDKKDFLKCIEEFPALKSAKIFSTKNIKTKDALNWLPQRWENALRSRWYQRELNRPADGSLIKYYPILTQLLKEQKFDIIILENIATLNAVKIIRRYDKEVKIIYNAHNVDSNLAKAAFERKEISIKQLKGYHDFESRLYKTVDAIFTCSEDDKNIFEEMNNGQLKVEVVPNGVSVPAKKYSKGVNEQIPRFLIFCGSLWSIPNAEGLHWFCKRIWPLVLNEFPGLKLLVVGIGELPEKYAEAYNTPSTEFTGAVDDVKPWYNKATISVVPLLTGSGTRLKILEAMGMGVPVISTTIGAEGIDYMEGKEIMIADKESDFAYKVTALFNNKDQRIMMSEEARKLASAQYNWNVIGEKLASFLKKELLSIKSNL
ncbi:MAG: glycosyltransferase family 4 protein [Ginsengibacter sp.]